MEYDALKKVGEVYLETESVKETAERCKISEVKARRILITLGMWSSPSSERVAELVQQGYSTVQIAETLSLSVKAVEAYLPYRRGVYGLDEKSAYAIRSELYRERKKSAEGNMMKKSSPAVSEGALSDVAWKQLVFTDADVVAPPQKHESFVNTEGAVYHLRFELAGSDELTEAEKKLAKTQHSISRDVLVPGSMNLHTMHYMIQRIFGWQNAHLHHYALMEDDFNLVTAGRFGTYTELCGPLFRFPCADLGDLHWDGDFEDSVSVKTWLKSKYSEDRPHLSVNDTWVGNQQRLQDFQNGFPDVEDSTTLDELSKRIMFEQDFNQLSERVTVREVFTVGDACPDVRFWKAGIVSEHREMRALWKKENQDEIQNAIMQLHQWRVSLNELKRRLWQDPEATRRQIRKQFQLSVEALLLKHEQAIEGWVWKLAPVFNAKYNVSPAPFFDTLNYFYDYGDGWQVKITVVDCYRAQTGTELGGGWEMPFCIEDKKAMAYSRYFHANGQEVSEELRDLLAMVFFKHIPLCVEADGLNVLDDCGGVGGFVDMLRTIYGRGRDESVSLREWANSLGWTGRKTKPENIL